jgi:SAM-dependent methyltransferase
MTLLYHELADWWPLLSAPEDYEEDAEAYALILQDACDTPPRTVLELGSGGGNNASYLKERFALTLTDLSPAMLDVSRRLNPECEHVAGDMRTLRLGCEFDAVFVQDAIGYMVSEADLMACMQTAFVHCRGGGAALFVPDYTAEVFRSSTYHGGYDGEEGRSLRYLQWDHAPAGGGTSYAIDFAYLLQEPGVPMRVLHEQHLCGLFSVDTWYRLLKEVGFEPDSLTLETEELESGSYRVFVGYKRG